MIHGLLPLTRTLITFDVETTGVDPKTDRIIQIGLVTTQVDGEVFERVDLINPGIPIPPEAMAVHHITDEMVADAPPFSAFATALAYEFGQADVCGYSVNFDLAFHWVR
jgi:DNA polymerase-3 subunit epsilon